MGRIKYKVQNTKYKERRSWVAGRAYRMNPEGDEAEVFAGVFYSMLKARIVAGDIDVFNNLVSCYFPGISISIRTLSSISISISVHQPGFVLLPSQAAPVLACATVARAFLLSTFYCLLGLRHRRSCAPHVHRMPTAPFYFLLSTFYFTPTACPPRRARVCARRRHQVHG